MIQLANRAEYLPVYCDMTTEAGAFALLVTSAHNGWTPAQVLSRYPQTDFKKYLSNAVGFTHWVPKPKSWDKRHMTICFILLPGTSFFHPWAKTIPYSNLVTLLRPLATAKASSTWWTPTSGATGAGYLKRRCLTGEKFARGVTIRLEVQTSNPGPMRDRPWIVNWNLSSIRPCSLVVRIAVAL